MNKQETLEFLNQIVDKKIRSKKQSKGYWCSRARWNPANPEPFDKEIADLNEAKRILNEVFEKDA